MPTPPVVNHRIVEALLQDWLPQAKGRRLVLVYGRYDDPVTEFSTTSDQTRWRVYVTDQHSVLGIVEAWQDHQATHPGDDVLVVTTSVDDAQLGWDIRGYALGRGTRTVDRGRIVAQRFGAVDIDPRIRRETWLLDALLDAEPPDGWPRNGSVLTRDTAVRALIGARLGRAPLGEGALDAGALLEWSRDPAGPARFAGLPRAEQDGLTAWLAGAVGDIAPLLMRLAAQGRAADAMPIGVVGAAVTRPEVSPEAALAFGGLLGGVRAGVLRALTDAVEGTLARWVTESESGSRHSAGARRQVLAVVARADELAASVALTDSLAGNRFLPSSFAARLRALATALGARPDPETVARADTALDAVRDHCLARLDPGRYRAAEMAVRLLRWLAQPPEGIESVAAGVRDQLADRAWVDWALAVLWAGEPGGDPVVGQLYRAVWEQVRARRDQLDEAFAQRLAVWSRHASVQDSGGCLLIEQVLATVAVPLAATRPPLVVVLDGMSGAVAVELGEQLAAQSWTEVSPAQRRAAAVAVIPSVTGTSRASLLAGALMAGEQPVEQDRFAAFWRTHRKEAALFHKSDIGGAAGHRLADALVTALAGEGVVGVVLNTIDDALDHGKEGDRTGWSLRDITYLPELLDAARDYDRPVLLVSDHGHVLDRGAEGRPGDVTGVESARWRTGTPESGEVALAGPRVLHGDGAIVAAWREDIRYTYRKYGYHGGASLAEVTVPVLVLLPSAELTPAGWQVLAPETLTPPWWQRSRAGSHTSHPVIPPPKPSRARKPQPPDAVPLFTVDQPGQPPETLGARVVATEVYQRQRLFVRRAPEKQVVAAVIDALVEADNVLSLSAIVTVAGRAARSPFFAAALQRLLNVDGYPVLSVVDGERRLKLEPEMLRMQFGVRDP